MKENRKQEQWQELCCLADRMHVKIPGDYRKPAEEVMTAKFPSGIRPQEVYSNPEGSKVLTFNLWDKPLQEQQEYPKIETVHKLFGHMYPESTKVKPEEIKTEAGNIEWFAFAEGTSIHCMFTLPIEENMLFGSYHFPAEGMETDKTLFVEILKSIRIK